MSDQLMETASKEELDERLRLTELRKVEAERELAEAERKLRESKRKLEETTEKLTEAKDELKFFKTASIDINKLTFEAMKHLTTLSAGSIVLMVTFLEKLFNTSREWIGLVGVALIAFVLSILFAVSVMRHWPLVVTLLVSQKDQVRPEAAKYHRKERWAFYTFLVGMSCLVVFALKNIY
jgi:hypothetical protein